ncbi:TetR/AcrR family transcriptional regulator [Paenibacillus oralis]|uniref:TetR/AcrR family transcriptional regulator n=1 Tax=Paenibacillus oralis TaxID=2490856 RepID=A0A3P3U2Q8_9BACL|nr:TetR-like C-terminal domain-containing protein [Paenibacillus oralis]RRJ62853.1 TetR/AcrR family transcriptional regulator [Paenibacillus oralis]
MTAVSLIEEKGFENFSLHTLAKKLGVTTTSLYNFIESATHLSVEIGKVAISQLYESMTMATGGITDSRYLLMEFAVVYRKFALQHPELYKVMINMPSVHGKEHLRMILDPMADALKKFSKDGYDNINLLRAYRSMIHGFVSLEITGYFELSNVSIDESFILVVKLFVDSLRGGIEF